MSTLVDAFNCMADIRLWFNLKSGIELKMADVPELIPYRWNYFKEKWEDIKLELIDKIPNYGDPEKLQKTIDSFSRLVETQRSDSIKGNPLSSKNVVITYYAVFDNLSVYESPLTNNEQRILDTATNRVTQFTKNNFIYMRGTIQAAHDALSDSAGGTDADYNRVKHRSPEVTLKSTTPSDIQQLSYFIASIGTIDYILVNYFMTEAQLIDPFALARTNANNDEFDITSSNSGTLVRMNFGEDLSSLATRYLGNSDRWLEIAITNGLKPPYVDEIGETIPLLANGKSSQINLAALGPDNISIRNKLYVNQIVFVRSATVVIPEQRVITSIKEIAVSGELVIELSGDSDLSKFTTADSASIQIFKPNTTNSNFFIMIPTGYSEAGVMQTEAPWFMRTKKEDERRAKIDLLVNDNNDLVFTPNGDLALSYGVSNAMQALKLKFSTEQGELPRVPGFGIKAIIGNSTSNTAEVQAQLTQSIIEAIEADDRFSQVVSLDVSRITNSTTSGFLVKLVVKLAGTGSAIPISFAINPN